MIDCRDPQRLAEFWCEVLDFIVLDTDDGAVEFGPPEGFGGLQPTLAFSPTTEPRTGKLRLHIDVNATDRNQDAELERLLKLGARPADIGQSGVEPWHCPVDPEGNEFCLLRARLSREAARAGSTVAGALRTYTAGMPLHDILSRTISADPAVYGRSTCTGPMGGPGDPWAVVDSVGAVKGVSELRVADASILPEVPSSTTKVTVIMVAEHICQRVYAG